MKGKVFWFMIAMALGAKAQDVTHKDSVTQLDEVILLDALKKKNALGLVPSEVISAKVFQNYSPVSAVQAINQIPGVHIFSGSLNTNRITVRGIGARTLFGTNKLRMYYHDIPITNGAGTSEIEAFDIENLSQIEIIKGPKGTGFGSNLGGAILLDPKEAVGISTNFSNNFTFGSFSLLKNNLSFNHNDGNLRLGVQYGHTETTGFRQNSKFERDGLLLNASYRINGPGEISVLVNHIDYMAQIASSLGATAFAEDPRQAAANWFAAEGFEANNFTLIGANYSHTFNGRLENSTSIFYNYLDHFERRPITFGDLDEFTFGYGFRSRFNGKLDAFGLQNDFTLGIENYHDVYDWELLKRSDNTPGSLLEKIGDNKEFRKQWNAFGTFKIPLTQKFTAQAGLAINKTSYDYRDNFNSGAANKSADRNFKAIVLPSLDLNYAFSPNEEVYFNVSRGFSNPTLEETLTPDGVVNPEIAQETGTNYELGTQLYLDDRNFQLNIAIYQMNVANLLVAERVGEDQFIGRNAGKTRHRGIEISMGYFWKISQKIQVSPFVNYTLNDHMFIDFVDNAIDFSGNQLTGVPKQLRTSGIQLRLFENFYWNTTHQHVSKIPLTDANSLYSEPYNLFTTRVGYLKQIAQNFTIGADLGVNNVLNAQYAASVLINTMGFGGAEPRYYYPGDARNFYASIRLGYKI